MFVLALIGLLIQSHRCRSFMMKCFHIRDNQGPSTFDSRRAIDLLLTAASCKRRPCDYSLHIRAPWGPTTSAYGGDWRRPWEKISRRNAEMAAYDWNMCRSISEGFWAEAGRWRARLQRNQTYGEDRFWPYTYGWGVRRHNLQQKYRCEMK